MAVKEQLHEIIDKLPPEELHAALRFLQFLRGLEGDHLMTALLAAPVDDEPTTAAEDRGADKAWREYLRGEAISAEEAKRELLS